MFKIVKKFVYGRVLFVHVLLVCCTANASLTCCEPFGVNELVFEDLGDMSDVYDEIEQLVLGQEEVEESEYHLKGNFLKKWTRKLKRYFLKNIKKVLKKCLSSTDFGKCKTVDDFAYIAACYKRDVDKICNTGSIDGILKSFDSRVPTELRSANTELLKERIKFYSNNKHARPPKNYKLKGVDQDVPTNVLVGGVEVFCAALIFMIPLPSCRVIAGIVLSDGLRRLGDEFVVFDEK